MTCFSSGLYAQNNSFVYTHAHIHMQKNYLDVELLQNCYPVGINSCQRCASEASLPRMRLRPFCFACPLDVTNELNRGVAHLAFVCESEEFALRITPTSVDVLF